MVGVARNAALVAALRQKRAQTELVVRPENPRFEAWGCALLTTDEPRHRRAVGEIESPEPAARP